MSDTSTREQSRDNAISVAAISSERIEPDDNAWTRRLGLFLRIMAGVSIAKGPSHSAQGAGFIGGGGGALQRQPGALQSAQIYFAVIELVGEGGAWRCAPG